MTPVPATPAWPDGKRFAFTIFDDTDRSTLDNAPAVYALLRDLGIGVVFGIALGAAMHRYTDAALPWLDAMLAALSLVAQWWQARRHTATWWLWIVVDVVYIGMYLVKSLNLTAALYLVFIGLAVVGLRSWTAAGKDGDPPQLQPST